MCTTYVRLIKARLVTATQLGTLKISIHYEMADILVGTRNAVGRRKEFNHHSNPFYHRRQKEACPSLVESDSIVCRILVIWMVSSAAPQSTLTAERSIEETVKVSMQQVFHSKTIIEKNQARDKWERFQQLKWWLKLIIFQMSGRKRLQSNCIWIIEKLEDKSDLKCWWRRNLNLKPETLFSALTNFLYDNVKNNFLALWKTYLFNYG